MAGTAVATFDLSKMAVAARTMAAAMPSPMSFLKMDKSGDWSYGAESDEIPAGTQFAVNPMSFQRGFVAWQDTRNGQPAAKLDERMYSAFEELPEVDDPPKGSRGWEPQFGFSMKAINGGKIAGTELQYRSSSDGGKRAVAALMTEIAEGAAANPGKIPLIVLDSRSYKHAAYGKIYAPTFKLVKWVPMPKEPNEKVAPARKSKSK
jgi:hypothetical protein